ncbi:MAG: photosynthetic reaction center subunit H [Gemmatirosa sp.]
MTAPTNAAEANPLLSGMGPAAYADRADVPDLTVDGEPKIVPMRAAPHFFVEPRDPDPRGMTVIGADGGEAGVVTELWVDRSEPQLRYLEVRLTGVDRTVLVPAALTRISARAGRVKVASILAHHFADVPSTARPDRITLREEDRIMAYYAAGHMYATPRRFGPLL